MIAAGRIGPLAQAAIATWAPAKCCRARRASAWHTSFSLGCVDDLHRRAIGDAAAVEQLARQIEPAALRILAQVAQDVGELQRAAEVIGDVVGLRFGRAERAHRQAADRTRHPVAIEVERVHRRGDDVLDRVHLHAVDHRQEILAPQVELLDARQQRRGDRVLWRHRHRASRSRRASLPAGASCRRSPPARRRCRRPRGRRRRSRTWRRAAPAAAAASPNRTRCRTPAPWPRCRTAARPSARSRRRCRS